VADSKAIARAARQADISFDSLGGTIGSAALEGMGAGSTFVGYGLLSGQNVRSSGRTVACYCRFHLRDALAEMGSAEWQRQFACLWSALAGLDPVPARIFQAPDWRNALMQAIQPGAEKSMLCFDQPIPRAFLTQKFSRQSV
jgi:NADPH:quinone reductase-like Zn-dependent oxidoreductase